MSFQSLLLNDADGTRTITINRPDQLNALNRDTIAELDKALIEAEADRSVRVIILTGSGQKAFVAGADIKEFAHFSVEEGRALSAEGHQKLFDHVEKLNKPTIAAVNGFALGGVIPGYGGTQRLARLVGRGKALEMIFTAGMIKADEALQWGLVNHVVPQADLLAKSNELAAAIIKNSPTALAAAIRAVNAAYEPGVNGMQREIEEFGKCFGTADFKEGTTAFMEKRKANFKGV